MRKITNNELPPDFHHRVVIQAGERTRYQKLTQALERTLNRCNEIRADSLKQTFMLAENYKKQGFETGFQLFFTQLVNFIDDYSHRQQQRQTLFRLHLTEALKNSLNDPIIVERIINHIQDHCEHQKAIRIIIPAKAKLPDGCDVSNYHYSDDNYITVQNDMDYVRFPSDALCYQWLTHADNMISIHDDVTRQLLPKLFCDLATSLTELSQQYSSDPTTSGKDGNND